MPWPAFHVLDEHITKVIPHGDAVVTGLDGRVDNPYVVASGNVDAVGVRAILGGGDCDVLEGDVATRDAVDVEVLAVLGGDVLDDGVVDKVQAQVDGTLWTVLVYLAVPGLLALPIEYTAARDGQEVDVVDRHPFLGLHGEFGRVRVGFEVAFDL